VTIEHLSDDGGILTTRLSSKTNFTQKTSGLELFPHTSGSFGFTNIFFFRREHCFVPQLQFKTPECQHYVPSPFRSHPEVTIGNPERHVRKASHCGSKQQQTSPDEITLLLLVRATYIWVLFFAHIPFVVNRAFNAAPPERLQQ